MAESFWHNCIWSDCPAYIEDDTHPWCYLHTPPSGPVVAGYSAKTAVEMLSPFEIVTELLGELVKQKKKGGQGQFFEDLSLTAKIETAKVWLKANSNVESRPALSCQAHLTGDAEAL